jgi:plastocyanin
MMITTLPVTATSPLRQRLIEDMNMRRFSRATQRNYIRDVGPFATFLRRPPDTATADDVRRFQVEQSDAGLPAPTMNSIVAALRFFFTQRNRAFGVREIAVTAGDTIKFSNEDEFLHQIFIASPALNFDSVEQPPGQTIEVKFPTSGSFEVLCHIHPKMRLAVTVH